MKYRAEWNSLTGNVKVFEDGEVIHEEVFDSAWGAGDFVKANGFGFTGMWTKNTDTDIFIANLEMNDDQAVHEEFPRG